MYRELLYCQKKVRPKYLVWFESGLYSLLDPLPPPPPPPSSSLSLLLLSFENSNNNLERVTRVGL